MRHRVGVGRSFPVWTAQFPETISHPEHAKFPSAQEQLKHQPVRRARAKPKSQYSSQRSVALSLECARNRHFRAIFEVKSPKFSSRGHRPRTPSSSPSCSLAYGPYNGDPQPPESPDLLRRSGRSSKFPGKFPASEIGRTGKFPKEFPESLVRGKVCRAVRSRDQS